MTLTPSFACAEVVRISDGHTISIRVMLALMLMEALAAVRHAGAEVRVISIAPSSESSNPDAIVEISLDGVRARFVVEERKRPPYGVQLEQIMFHLSSHSSLGRPMVVAPFVSESVAEQLDNLGIAWADASGNVGVRAPGMAISRRMSSRPAQPASRGVLPQGSGSHGIIRALIGFDPRSSEEPGATGLAAQAGVTQPRASQVLARLRDLDLVKRTAQGRWQPDREGLLERFLLEYRGPGGSELTLYSLDDPREVARRAALAARGGRRCCISADVGPDLVAPWRRPTAVIIYTTDEVDASRLGAVESGRDQANVFVRFPDDRSVFPSHRIVSDIDGVEVELADMTQLIWDLEQLGGEDRREGAERLRSWLLFH